MNTTEALDNIVALVLLEDVTEATQLEDSVKQAILVDG